MKVGPSAHTQSILDLSSYLQEFFTISRECFFVRDGDFTVVIGRNAHKWFCWTKDSFCRQSATASFFQLVHSYVFGSRFLCMRCVDKIYVKRGKSLPIVNLWCPLFCLCFATMWCIRSSIVLPLLPFLHRSPHTTRDKNTHSKSGPFLHGLRKESGEGLVTQKTTHTTETETE